MKLLDRLPIVEYRALQRVTSSPQYRDAQGHYRGQADRAVADVSTAITASLSRASFGIAHALCLRGSFARHSPDPFSDLDIALIADSTSQSFTEMLGDLLRYATGRRVSVRRCSPNDINGPNVLSDWLAIPTLAFIGGQPAVYDEFMAIAKSTLTRVSFRDLLNMLLADPLRGRNWCHPESPHFANMKRGCGGSLEAAFILLLDFWRTVRNDFRSLLELDLFSHARQFCEYLAIAKDHIRRRMGAAVETFHVRHTDPDAVSADTRYATLFLPSVIERIAAEHHTCLLHIIALLAKETGDDDFVTTAIVPKLRSIQ